jgi:hypothetical protein
MNLSEGKGSEESSSMQIEGLQSPLYYSSKSQSSEVAPLEISAIPPQDTTIQQETTPQDTAPQDTALPDPDISQLPLFSLEAGDDQRALTLAEFEYTVKIMNTKIDAIYRLCRFLGDEQRDIIKGVKKLVAIDELSDGFWKVFVFDDLQSQIAQCTKVLLFCYSIQIAYRDVAKKLLPVNLYPNPREYREALEKYLSEHAEDFIDTIGQFSWISLFNEKLLSEVRRRFFSRNTLTNAKS